jgi:non-ribosomal peptide synthetase component F
MSSLMSVMLGEVERLPEDVSLLHHLFERNSASNGDVKTVDVNGVVEVIAYTSLNQLSNVIARRLATHCQLACDSVQLREQSNLEESPGSSTMKMTCVAIDVEPSTQLIASLLAILKLGLAYVPIDSKSTAVNRIDYILQVSSS